MTSIAIRVLAVGVAAAWLAGCAAPPSRIQTSKAEGYSKQPKRMFVLSTAGNDWGNEFANSFESRITAIGTACGTTVQVSRINPLELDENVHANRMKAFNPDAILTVRNNGGTKSAYGALIDVIYDLSLRDVQANKLVWRANVRFVRGATLRSLTERGETLAIEITNKLKQEGLLAGCPVLPIPT